MKTHLLFIGGLIIGSFMCLLWLTSIEAMQVFITSNIGYWGRVIVEMQSKK